MKIKCEYCDSMFDDTLENCPACGAPNANVRRSTSDQPTTIGGLMAWYDSKGLPGPEVTRFFIGQDYRGPRAFGIYKDENSGKFIVYKNKADGSRAVRYEGTDEAFAVNELHTRLKQEILQQKAHNLNAQNYKSSFSRPSSGRRRKSSSLLTALITLFCMFGIPAALFGIVTLKTLPAAPGYYQYGDSLYYHYDKDIWGYYSDDYNEWRKCIGSPNQELARKKPAKKYFLSEEYKPEYGGIDFYESTLYQDILNNFTVTQGYYNYGGNTYYHLSPQQDAGWYIYDTDTGDWDDVWITDIPADLKHQNTATDFWYTPTWDESTQYSDFEQTEIYQDYKAEQERQAYEAAHDNDDSDDDYSWDSGDSWDSGSTDWDSDW